MLQAPAPAGLPPVARRKAAPLTGMMIGTAISLLLWAMILAIVLALR